MHGVLFWLTLACITLSAKAAVAVDLTDRIKRETDLNDRIAQICRDHCQGNRRRGWLEWLHADRVDAHRFAVRARAALKNHEHVRTPIGGGFAAYNFTIRVEADGELDTRNCLLTIRNIRVVNDRLGLSRLAAREEGKSHHIDNCRRLVRGL